MGDAAPVFVFVSLTLVGVVGTGVTGRGAYRI